MDGSRKEAHTLTKTELAGILRHYPLGELEAAWRPGHGFVNDNWIVETTQGRYFLKHRHPGLGQPDFVRCQHALVARLRQAGFPAPTLGPNVEGATLLVLEGQCYEVQEYIEGQPYDHSKPQHLEEAAMTLGRYHTLVDGFEPSSLCRLGDLYHPALLRANLAGLTQSWQLGRDPDVVQIVSQLAAHAHDLAARFARHGALPQLLIHGDYYADNLLFHGDHIVGVVDYDKARWQPRVVELAEALLYFASPRPSYLKHLVYPGVLQWEPFDRFLRAYARVTVPDEEETQTLPDYIQCIWLQISLLRLWEKGPRPTWILEALQEVLALGDWARDNAARIIDISHSTTKELS